MSKKIERYEGEAAEFDDEFSDEALDRPNSATAPFCCGFTSGSGGWVQPVPSRKKA